MLLSRGEDIGGPEVSARDEARNLGLSGVVTGLSSGVNKCGDRVVAAGGLAQGAAGYTVHRRVIVETDVNFNTPPLTVIATFMQDT